ncbi:MAG: hypothetical protein ACXVEF_21385 [Polyangiales bacterium]
MAKPFGEWTVLPHGKLTRVDDNLLTVTGVLRMPPMGDVERRMTVVRLGDGRLVVYSAIALDEAEMDALEQFGTPAFLVVPSDLHRMDIKTWKARYPAMKVVAPPGSRAKIEKLVPVDLTSVDFGEPSVKFVVLPGTNEREAALVVETMSGTTLVLNDLIFNLSNRPGVIGWIFQKIGLTGDQPHVAPPVARRLVKDRAALREQLERWSGLRRLKRVIISHGDIIDHDAAATLGRIARQLAA